MEETERERESPPLLSGTSLMGALFLWPHQDLIVSLRTHLQIPLHWRGGLKQKNLGRHNFQSIQPLSIIHSAPHSLEVQSQTRSHPLLPTGSREQRGECWTGRQSAWKSRCWHRVLGIEKRNKGKCLKCSQHYVPSLTGSCLFAEVPVEHARALVSKAPDSEIGSLVLSSSSVFSYFCNCEQHTSLFWVTMYFHQKIKKVKLPYLFFTWWVQGPDSILYVKVLNKR